MPNKREYYFGASDLQMEAFADEPSFRRSLLLHILFHGDLVIPDVFLYVSTRLRKIISSNDPIRPFLAEGVRNGAIVPAFRNEANNTFRDNSPKYGRRTSKECTVTPILSVISLRQPFEESDKTTEFGPKRR